MRTYLVVVPSPSFYQHLCLSQCVEYLSVEQLVPELAVVTLVVAILPRTARLDKQGFDVESSKPVSDRQCGELRSVVRPDMFRWSVTEK